MRPLQDKCDASSFEDLDEMVLEDLGLRINDLFNLFDPKPIGIASLAQVHIGQDKKSGMPVAVKVKPVYLD